MAVKEGMVIAVEEVIARIIITEALVDIIAMRPEPFLNGTLRT
jgi:hypothetical protein